MDKGILRYSVGERVMHWLAAVTYIYLLLTGLAFYSPYLYWLATVLGGGPTSRFWHPWFGVAFVWTMFWMFRAWRADMRITEADRRWGRAMREYVENRDENLPPEDRFNLGQKYFFWGMLWLGIALLLSGLVLWFPERIPWSLRVLSYASVLGHASAALLTIGGFIVHVYMGTAMVRGGFTSIIRGEVSKEWARRHHRLWYERISGNR